MSRFEEIPTLLFTVKQLKEAGSWSGETHIQKTMYLCQKASDVGDVYKFVLYKHGPFSFELSDRLQTLISDKIIEVETRPPYGPSLVIADDFKLDSIDKKFNNEVGRRVKDICAKFGRRSVAELERVATAVFVNDKFGSTRSGIDRVLELRALKPHISIDAARQAFEEADALLADGMADA